LASAQRAANVFINCPFDPAYQPLFEAVVFAVAMCGYNVRSALEVVDSGDLRLQKIIRMIEDSRFSVHDVSRVELDTSTGFPRFNMPIELGIALGIKHLGRKALRDHRMLILDRTRYRYRKFASDLAGLDISEHRNRPRRIIQAVRDFLPPLAGAHMPGAGAIETAYRAFQRKLPAMAAAAQQTVGELTYADRLRHIDTFLAKGA
jgi:hypothetical protein